MKKWLIIAGVVVALAIGSMASGLFFSSASTNGGIDGLFNNRVSENKMMYSSQGPGMMNMMGYSSGMNMMANMNGTDMMGTMSIMHDLMVSLFDEAAKTLGMTTEQLQTVLQSGKSLEAISEEEGLIKEELIKKLEDVIHRDLERLKKEGSLTTEEQENMLLFMSENIGMVLNAKGMFACNVLGGPNYSSY